jgi:hypothetical protein
MSERDMEGDDVSDILRQFPGPVRLFPSKTRTLVTSIGLPAVLALLVWITLDAAAQGKLLHAVLMGACALVLAYAGIITVWAFITDLYFITLNAEGFETQFAWRNRRRLWRDVDRFAVRPYGRNATIVGFDDLTIRSGLVRAVNILMFGRTSMLPGVFGLTDNDFARLMTEWRTRALGR